MNRLNCLGHLKLLFIAGLVLSACSGRSLTPPPPHGNLPDAGSDTRPCSPDDLVCYGAGENTVCVCRKKDGAPPTPPGSWSCDAAKTVCEKLNDNRGLPPGGTEWKCHLVSKNGVSTWVCYGRALKPPGGNGWNCVKVKTELGVDIYRCERPDGPSEIPPHPGAWVCVKGSSFGGHICSKVDGPPQPPPPYPGLCKVGQRMWCDGLVYGGLGQVQCDPATGKWKSKMVNGKKWIDCSESLAGGKRPNTVCACYHFFFNPACCEQIDCVVPPGTSGQICPPSPGKLCDYCNPLKPECSEPGAKCINTNTHETFCGRDCATQKCPSRYTCMTIKLQIGTTKQCVPNDLSCYY